MHPSTLTLKLKPLYNDYNNIIKPLIADIEARYESFPLPLFNELRAFTDHVSRCYKAGESDEFIEGEIKKAKGHIMRIILDCYKFLNLHFHSEIKKINKKYIEKCDARSINSGEFMTKFRKLQTEAIQNIRSAKATESTDKVKAFQLFEKAYNVYTELSDLIDEHYVELIIAKSKRFFKISGTTIAWIISIFVSAIISAFISHYISCEDLITMINNIVKL